MAKTVVMAGTQKGGFILESDEGRKDWKVTGPLLKGWSCMDLTLDQRDKPRMHAAVGHFVYGPGVHFSDDLGKTWTQVENPPKYPEGSFKLNNIWTIVPGRKSEPGVLYAGVDEAGLFVTRDGGLHWEEMSGLTSHPTRPKWQPGNGGLCLHTILLDPANMNRMWAGISAVGVFRTDDAGKTWQARNQGLQFFEGDTQKEIGTCVHRIVLDPKNPSRLFQQNHQGLFRSYDAADTWERIENGLPSIFGFPMVMHPRDANTLFIVPQESDEYRLATNGNLAVYRTTNAGDSWEPLRKGLPDSAFVGVLRQAMAVDDYEKPGVYFGTSSGQVYYSRDAGESWDEMPLSFPRISSVNVAILP